MTEYLEEVKSFPAEWETNETPSRKVILLGRSAIDPDIYVANLAGVEGKVWVMTYSGSIIGSNPPIKALPTIPPPPNPLPTTEGVTHGWQDINERLFADIEHGDAEHRAWLKAKLNAFFSALPPPPGQ